MRGEGEASVSTAVATLFAGRGPLRAACRGINWGETPLGPVSGWSTSLRTVVRLCLDAPTPMCLWAGPERVLIYNEGYGQTLGSDRHLWALGRRGREVFEAYWSWLGPELEYVGQRGERRRGQRMVPHPGLCEGGRCFTYSHSPVREPDGTVVGVLSIVRDATRQRRIEEALRESQERYRAVFENAQHGFVVVEPLFDDNGELCDLRYLLVNPAFERQTGLSAAAFQGRRLADVLGGLERHWLEAFARAAKTGKPVRSEGYNVHTGRWYEAVVFPHPNGLLAESFIDVTARKNAERKARETEKRQTYLLALSDRLRLQSDPLEIKACAVRLLGEHLGVERVCYVKVLEGEGVGVIRAMYRRHDHGDAPSKPCLDVYAPGIMTEFQAGRSIVVEDVAHLGNVTEAQRRAYREAGIGAWLGVPVIKCDRLRAILVVVQSTPRAWSRAEITMVKETAERAWAAVERARVEEALREANERLLEADRRKDEFLAMLGHELRNPLGAIRSGTEVLMRARDEQNHTRLETACAIIERQSRHMARLVDGLLEVSRITRGKIHLELTSVDLCAIAEDVLHDRYAHAIKRGLELWRELPVEPLWVMGDRVRLIQVIDNLLGNAIKFTSSPGSIRVSLCAQDGAAVVRVKDTGAGIRPELLPHLFEPFQQESQGIGRAAGGLGLGLAIAKGMIDLHGGGIEAYSEGPGTGAEFVVRLPLSAAPQSAQASTPHAPSKKQRILLVEDNLDALTVMRDLLELAGHDVAVATNGADVLDRLRQRRPDVVLCDLGLPGMSGYDVARAIRRDDALRDTFLVALTGYGQPEDHAMTKQAGFDEHLTKPVDLNDLVSVLNRFAPEESRR